MSKDLRNHPLFGAMLTVTGGDEKKALKILKQQLDDNEKNNQVTSAFDPKARKITIPSTMNKLQAAQELERQWNDEENVIEMMRQFEEWNWKDVLVAVKKVSEEHFGWIQGKTIRSFFGVTRPKEVEIVTNITDGKVITETCFYGTFTASIWEDADVDVGPGYVEVTGKKKYSESVNEFLDKIQEHLRTNSIYRGKAITVTAETNPWGKVSMNFEIFELKESENIILNEDVEDIIQNYVLDEIGEQGKRCFLFSGGYGTGKTETAMRVGAEGIEKGMAFFYCKDAELFHDLLKNGINYQPALIFLEDLDEIGSGEKRDSRMNKILNTLDGVQTKNNSLTVLFTTNHEKKINPALRRPGRIDLVVKFENPNAEALKRIYKAYLEEVQQKYATEDIDYDMMVDTLGDIPGAVAAETGKRAKQLCERKEKCDNSIIKSAINSMKHQIELMSEPVEQASTGDMTITVSGASITTSKEGVKQTVTEED